MQKVLKFAVICLQSSSYDFCLNIYCGSGCLYYLMNLFEHVWAIEHNFRSSIHAVPYLNTCFMFLVALFCWTLISLIYLGNRFAWMYIYFTIGPSYLTQIFICLRLYWQLFQPISWIWSTLKMLALLARFQRGKNYTIKWHVLLRFLIILSIKYLHHIPRPWVNILDNNLVLKFDQGHICQKCIRYL